ncbi:hypothetical protein IFR05_014026 [Cadophora sp. M221]|nr:hypothetical protein IFR05_014026 [Cadophora sp. M221]
MYQDDIKVRETFDDDYRNRAKAAGRAKMKVSDDLTYDDLGLVQPEGRSEVGALLIPKLARLKQRKIPNPEDVSKMRLIDKDTGENFMFKSQDELRHFKYQRYMKRYLRTIASIDDNVGRFFLGDHGWFDKRFMYEESFQMPFLIRYPRLITPGSICRDIVSNVDFASSFLDLAGLRIPSYMQGKSFQALLRGVTPEGWKQVAYHQYWMHDDFVHEASAHYGVRNQKWKLIYWYNLGYGLPGTGPGGQEREWELFDCERDPLELVNVYHEPGCEEVVR